MAKNTRDTPKTALRVAYLPTRQIVSLITASCNAVYAWRGFAPSIGLL